MMVTTYDSNIPDNRNAYYNLFVLPEKLIPGKKIPGFRITDFTGDKFDLYDYMKSGKEKYYLLDFWASWCVPCRRVIERHRAENVVISHRKYRIIYLSIDENDKLWKAVKYPFLHSKNGFRITGPDNSLIREFGIYTIPRYILIMKGGIVSRDFGFK